MRRKKGRPLDGWLVIDKPPGMTSTTVVNRVRRGFDAQKAGHGGTLDPLATGVLPVAFGAATKTVPYVMDGTKLYRFTLRLGEQRDTDAADGAVLLPLVARHLAPGGMALLPKGAGSDRELTEAAADWHMDVMRHQSRTESDGTILQVSGLRAARRCGAAPAAEFGRG